MKYTIELDGQAANYKDLPAAYRVKVDHLKSKIKSRARRVILVQYQSSDKIGDRQITVFGDPVSDGTAKRSEDAVGASSGRASFFEEMSPFRRERFLERCGLENVREVQVIGTKWEDGWFFSVNAQGYSTVEGVIGKGIAGEDGVVFKTKPAELLF